MLTDGCSSRLLHTQHSGNRKDQPLQSTWALFCDITVISLYSLNYAHSANSLPFHVIMLQMSVTDHLYVPSPHVTSRKSEVEIVEYLVHGEANREEYFERPPFVALINSLTVPGLPDFIVIGVHIRPLSAEAEINRLVGVYEDMAEYFGIDQALLLGDFNAACRYLSKTAFNRLNLTADDRFTWLIDEDTTLATSPCAYDRCVHI